jgi:hypothetical protein
MSEASGKPQYPLLQEILDIKGRCLQATYTNHDLATLFGVSVRSIQERVTRGQLNARNLPGKAKFLSSDLEGFSANSGKRGRK